MINGAADCLASCILAGKIVINLPKIRKSDKKHFTIKQKRAIVIYEINTE
jgi:hypothetical protein